MQEFKKLKKMNRKQTIQWLKTKRLKREYQSLTQ